MARTPREVHVVIRLDASAVEAAWDRLEAAQARLEAIRPCPSMHPAFAHDVVPLACGLTADHGGPHRDRDSILEW